jgi:uncharacterized protein YndB with AHSA1/START domain
MSPASLTRRLRAPFTRTVTTAVDIDRPAAQVWAVLTDFAGYPQWNPQIRRAEGELVAGRRVRLRMHPPNGRPVTIRPRVILVAPRRELRRPQWSMSSTVTLTTSPASSTSARRMPRLIGNT